LDDNCQCFKTVQEQAGVRARSHAPFILSETAATLRASLKAQQSASYDSTRRPQRRSSAPAHMCLLLRLARAASPLDVPCHNRSRSFDDGVVRCVCACVYMHEAIGGSCKRSPWSEMPNAWKAACICPNTFARPGRASSPHCGASFTTRAPQTFCICREAVA